MSEGLGRWPVSISLPVQWGEMDALRHVNNTVYMRWFETSRMEYFRQCGILDQIESEDIGPILASTRIEFREALTWPDTVTVGATISRLGKSSFTMLYRLHSEALGRLAAEGEGVIVMVDYGRGQSVPLGDALRHRIETLEAHGAG